MMLDTCNEQFDISYIACVASVSVLFRSKEWGTRVKDRAKNGAIKRAGRGLGRKVGFFPSPSPSPSFLFWFSFHFSRGQNRKSLSTVIFCPETKRKRLLRRLPVLWHFVSRLTVLDHQSVGLLHRRPKLCKDKCAGRGGAALLATVENKRLCMRKKILRSAQPRSQGSLLPALRSG